MSVLSELGWGPFFSSQLTLEEGEGLRVGRAVEDLGPRLLVRFEDGDRLVVVPGRLKAAGQVPVVGDFLLAGAGDEPPVVRVLERRSSLSRGVAGRRLEEQVLAANLDRVLVVQGLDVPVNARRLERTLAAVHAGGAEPVVVLTKADLVDAPEAAVAEAAAVAGGARVLAVSCTGGAGLEALRAELPSGVTGALVGPSGAGKSTLLNALAGEAVQPIGAVREADRRGRHTTTGRRLFLLPGGGALVDGPGIRELKLWDGAGVQEVFDDVAEVAAGCRFADCRHAGEPGCAVAAAVAEGRLDPARVESQHKLEREVAAAAARQGGAAARAEKARWKAVSKEIKRLYKGRGR
ncbi:MAG: ribosome small subunit-dependent GTPase A [Anaeromyxobacter sp.]